MTTNPMPAAPPPDVVQFRPSVFRVPASALHRVDGRERIGAPAGFLLYGGLLPGERDLHISDLGACGPQSCL